MEKNYQNIVKLKARYADMNYAPIFKDSLNNKLVYNSKNAVAFYKDCEYYHLYETTDKTPVQGDYVYSPVDEEVYLICQYNDITGVAREFDGSPFILDGCKKIIKTTEFYILLPAISEDLIEWYITAYNV